jgi:hypothetical protein
MLKETVYKYIIMFFVGIAALAAADELRASSPIKIDTTKAHLVIPRPAIDPVKPLFRSPSDPVDTLDTAHECIKVILFGDNTWQYYKTPEYQQTVDVYGEYWSTASVNPYGIELADVPSQWTIWCVDSLDQYHCPFQGDVHPRGKFGMRRGRRHQGVDLPLKKGDPIYAAFTGKVRMSKYLGAYGNVVVIRHENGIETFYAHLSERHVEADQWVNAGEVIGLGGSTGRSTGPHLHFETRYKGYAFDPQWLIDFKTGQLRHRLFVLKKKYFNIYSNYEQDFDDEAKNEEEDKKEDAEREAMRWYTIKSGDTLGGIAYRNNTTVKELCRLNNITTKTVLKIGRKIRVR